MDKSVLREKTINGNLLTESITFSVDGYDYGANPDTFYDVMTYLGRKVVNNILRKRYSDEELRAKKLYFMDMFALDGGQVNDQGEYVLSDTMNVYLGQFADMAEPIIKHIQQAVEQLPNVSLSGQIRAEQSNSRDSIVIRVPLNIEPSEENAPEMNLANGNAAALINALGLPFDDYSGKFSVQMLLGQIAVTRSKLSGMPIPDKSYMKDITPKPEPAKFGSGELGAKADVGNVKKQAFPAPALNEDIYENQMGKDQLMRYLDRLEEMCNWAVEHGYTDISFG
jgi:hypothetical protein